MSLTLLTICLVASVCTLSYAESDEIQKTGAGVHSAFTDFDKERKRGFEITRILFRFSYSKVTDTNALLNSLIVVDRGGYVVLQTDTQGMSIQGDKVRGKIRSLSLTQDRTYQRILRDFGIDPYLQTEQVTANSAITYLRAEVTHLDLPKIEGLVSNLVIQVYSYSNTAEVAYMVVH